MSVITGADFSSRNRKVTDDPSGVSDTALPDPSGIDSPAPSSISSSPDASAEANDEPKLHRTGTKASTDEGQDEEALPGFSRPASKLFYVQLNKYLVDLERFSRFKAKQGHDDSVSAKHIREAASFLSTSRVVSRFSRSCESIGGIVLGGGISELINLLQDKSYPARLVLLTAILIAVGAAMIGIFLGRD
jgi:hypothetical protein